MKRRDTAEATHSYLAYVRVAVLSHDALVVQDVLEGLAGETSLAAMIVEVLGTIHQLLLSQGHHFPTGNSHS